MNKIETNDDTLRELWAIKDATAKRFRTVEAYFLHLGSKQPVRQSTIKPAAKKRIASRPAAIL